MGIANITNITNNKTEQKLTPPHENKTPKESAEPNDPRTKHPISVIKKKRKEKIPLLENAPSETTLLATNLFSGNQGLLIKTFFAEWQYWKITTGNTLEMKWKRIGATTKTHRGMKPRKAKMTTQLKTTQNITPTEDKRRKKL